MLPVLNRDFNQGVLISLLRTVSKRGNIPRSSCRFFLLGGLGIRVSLALNPKP